MIHRKDATYMLHGGPAGQRNQRLMVHALLDLSLSSSSASSAVSIVHGRVGVARPDPICRIAIVQSRSRISSVHACSRRRVSVPISFRVAMVQVSRGADPAGPRSRARISRVHAKVGAARLSSVHYGGVSVPAKVGAAHPGNERVSISIAYGAFPSCACSGILFNERIAISQSSSFSVRRGGLPVQRDNGKCCRGVRAHLGVP